MILILVESAVMSLPNWANEAINESCQSTAWRSLISTMQTHLKSSLLTNNLPQPGQNTTSESDKREPKRFYEYNELEQAVLVEQELRQVHITQSFLSFSSHLLYSFNYKAMKVF